MRVAFVGNSGNCLKFICLESLRSCYWNSIPKNQGNFGYLRTLNPTKKRFHSISNTFLQIDLSQSLQFILLNACCFLECFLSFVFIKNILIFVLQTCFLFWNIIWPKYSLSGCWRCHGNSTISTKILAGYGTSSGFWVCITQRNKQNTVMATWSWKPPNYCTLQVNLLFYSLTSVEETISVYCLIRQQTI